jgi:hypothetical protein
MSPNSPAPDALVERHARAGRSLVAILHAIQDDAGYVPAGCVAPLARRSTCRAPKCMACSPTITTSAPRRPPA